MRNSWTASLVKLFVALLAAVAASACTSSTVTCPTGQTACNGTCVDLQSDPSHCGLCGISCPATATCTAGACTCPSATPDACGPRCVNKQTDASNCGSCNFACGLGTCQAAACVCNAGATLCSGACVNTQTDRQNCGGCGITCPSGFSCSAGTCTCTGDACPPPPATPTQCVSFDTDPRNCGGCGVTCASNQVCSSGTCVCASGFTSCGGACVDVQSDAANCGACGNACPSGQSCSAGKCTGGCATVTCNGTCCPGTACCAGAGGLVCQSKHDNGLSETFYSCTPVGTFNLDLARAAANRWAVGFSDVDAFPCGGTLCLARQALVGGINQCGVWCYDGALVGYMGLNQLSASCICPPSSPIWSSWY